MPKNRNDEAGGYGAPEANCYSINVLLYDVAKLDALQVADAIETILRNQGLCDFAEVTASHVKSARSVSVGHKAAKEAA